MFGIKKQIANKIIIIIFLFITLVINTLIFAKVEKIRVISPNGGEKLQIGTHQEIAWISKNIERVDIFYSVNNGDTWIEIAKNIHSKLRVFGWLIPNILDKQVLIKISSHKNRSIFDISDDTFLFSKIFSLKGNLNNKININSKTKIMALGNSITFGITKIDTAIGDKRGYRYPLYNSLINAGINFSFTGSEHAGKNFLPTGYDDNAGFPGITGTQLATLLKTGRRTQPFHGIDTQLTVGPYLETYPADIILLHIGTNGNNASGGTKPDDIEEILDEIKRYEDLTSTEITVVLARIIDRVPNKNYVTVFNNNIENMALDRVNNPANDAYPDKIIIVDMQDSTGLEYSIDTVGAIGNGIVGDMSDALHPNEKGYFKMAEVWFKAITSIISPCVKKPSISIQPKNFKSIEGESAHFFIVATGTKPLSYQWKKNGNDIVGATDTLYSIPFVTPVENNSQFSCVVSNSSGSDTSDSALLFVTGKDERIIHNLQVLYNFEQNSSKVLDISNLGNDLDLTIEDTTKTRWIPYGLEITAPTIISADSSPLKIYQQSTQSNEISLEAWLRPTNTALTGHARILTFSKDGQNRNFMLGQNNNQFNMRLTTTNTNANGEPSINSTEGSLTTELTHIVFTRNKNGVSKIYINGVVNASVIDTGNFSVWNNSFSFGLANEFTTDRSWLGSFYLTAIYSVALTTTEVEHNYAIGFNGDKKLLFVPTQVTSTVSGGNTLVNLSWQDNSLRELGYIVERRANSVDSVYYLLDTLGIDATSYKDFSTKHLSSYFYRIKAYNTLYTSDYSDTIKVDNLISGVKNEMQTSNFQLDQNYPNPFNPTTTITYSIPKASKVSLVIYDILGKVVEELIDNSKIAKGNYNYKFDASSSIKSNLTSGVYFYRLVATPLDGSESFIETKKLLLMK